MRSGRAKKGEGGGGSARVSNQKREILQRSLRKKRQDKKDVSHTLITNFKLQDDRSVAFILCFLFCPIYFSNVTCLTLVSSDPFQMHQNQGQLVEKALIWLQILIAINALVRYDFLGTIFSVRVLISVNRIQNDLVGFLRYGIKCECIILSVNKKQNVLVR